jgi:hypothetical protein
MGMYTRQSRRAPKNNSVTANYDKRGDYGQ